MVEPVMETEQDVILSRVGAFVVDHIISFVAALVVGLALAMALGRAGIWLGVFSGMFGYFIVLEGLFGQTFGKRLFGIVVVKRSGDPCTMGASLARNLLRIIDGILSYAVALVVMLTNDDRRRIGDVAADTVVVRAR